MRELGLVPCQPRPWRHSQTEQDGQAGDIPDLVRREFTAERPGQNMVGDITYVHTWQGWPYLATVIDCATRKIIGWAMDDNYKTPLITSAIEMAARNLAKLTRAGTVQPPPSPLQLVPATGLNLFAIASAFVRLTTLGVAECLACWRILADSSARTDVPAASGRVRGA